MVEIGASLNSDYVAKKPKYAKLSGTMVGVSAIDWESRLTDQIIPYCIEEWLTHYDLAASGGQVVEVSLPKFSYLFDLGPDRLVAAWGVSQGRFAGDRDKNRMREHPNSSGAIYHRGHAIPHRLGGGTDINLAAQLGSINIGPFRVLEKRAIETAGSLYFTYWMYGADRQSQVASRIQQGLLSYGAQPDIRIFDN